MRVNVLQKGGGANKEKPNRGLLLSPVCASVLPFFIACRFALPLVQNTKEHLTL